MKPFDWCYVALVGAAWLSFFASYRKAHANEEERAEFRASSWPSQPGQSIWEK